MEVPEFSPTLQRDIVVTDSASRMGNYGGVIVLLIRFCTDINN
jgi:hypothetical protein